MGLFSSLTHPKDVLSWRRNWLEARLEARGLPPGDFPGCTDMERRRQGYPPSPFGASFPWLGVAMATLQC